MEIIVKPKLSRASLTISSSGRVTLKVRTREEVDKFFSIAQQTAEYAGVPNLTYRGYVEEWQGSIIVNLKNARKERIFVKIALEGNSGE